MTYELREEGTRGRLAFGSTSSRGNNMFKDLGRKGRWPLTKLKESQCVWSFDSKGRKWSRGRETSHVTDFGLRPKNNAEAIQ